MRYNEMYNKLTVYKARFNFKQEGDTVLFYHSNVGFGLTRKFMFYIKNNTQQAIRLSNILSLKSNYHDLTITTKELNSEIKYILDIEIKRENVWNPM